MRLAASLAILTAAGGLASFGLWPNSPGPEWQALRAQFSDQQWARIIRTAERPTPNDSTNGVFHDEAAFVLGRALFYETRLSGNGEVSCASCHDPALDWSDGKTLAEGLEEIDRHTPSLWNSALNRWQFWDGRADSLWSQALQPIEHPKEMGGSREEVAKLVLNDPELRALYTDAFGSAPEQMDEPNNVERVFVQVGKALAAFEGRILTHVTPFDQFVSGLQTGDPEDLAALDPLAVEGAGLFFGEARCHLCHHGPLLSDMEFHDIELPREGAPEPARHGGVAKLLTDPFNGRGQHSDDVEAGRERLAYLNRAPHQRGEWKTPGLRNVARTAPYMHNGAYASLDEVLAHYSTLSDAPARSHSDTQRVLEPGHFSDSELQALKAFLQALSSPPPHPSLLPVNPKS
jgi:cytochrome c peroxidase